MNHEQKQSNSCFYTHCSRGRNRHLSAGAGLIVTAPTKVWAQETASDSAPNSEAIPAISIVKPASGKTYTVALTGANGYVHPQPGGVSIRNVTVLIHRDSGGSGKGYLDGSGHFQDASSENSGSYYRAAYVDNAKGTWSVSINLPSDDFEGKYTLKALVVDNAGKQNFAVAGFTVQRTTSGEARVQAALDIINARSGDSDPWRDSWRDSNGNDQTDPNSIRPDPPTVPRYTDCGRFVNAVVDGDGPFPAVSTGVQGPYIRDNWVHGSEMSDIQIGDVLWRQGHIAIYGGRTDDGKYIVLKASLEAGNGNGHGPQRDIYDGLNNFTMWGRPPEN